MSRGRARLMVHKSDDLELTLEITLRQKEWIDLRNALRDGQPHCWPANRFLEIVSDLISKAEAHFDDEFKDGATI